MSGKDASTSSVAIATAVPSPAEHKMQKEEDLTVFVADLMDQMQSRFKSMGDSIIGRMDELSGRLDELERSIAELMDQAGLEPQYGTTTGGLVGNNSSSSHANNNNNNNGDHNTKKESKAETQRSVL